jgi:hypothetical protein
VPIHPYGSDFRYVPGVDLGYARVSTSKLAIDRQVDALQAVRIDPSRIYLDTMSRPAAEQPGLRPVTGYRPGRPTRWPMPAGYGTKGETTAPIVIGITWDQAVPDPRPVAPTRCRQPPGRRRGPGARSALHRRRAGPAALTVGNCNCSKCCSSVKEELR